MGCNTSKEVQTADGNQKDDLKVVEEKTEETQIEDNNTASAKTVTLKSISRPNSTASKGKEEKEEKSQVNESVPLEDESGADEEQAAVKIQAAFRGHKTRKSMKQSDKPSITKTEPAPEPEPTREQLEEEFRADDKELCNAATKIQASFRGHMARKVKEEGKPDDEGPISNENAEELDIDLTDPELSKAAVKIQASFRGHMARKDNEAEK